MMAKKALLFNDKEIYEEIMNEDNPAIHQKLGRKVKNFDLTLWNEKCEDIVYQGNYYKFTQNKELFDILMKTENTIFVEASPYDLIWGVGLGEKDPLILDEKNWRGENLLGKTLTKLRDDLLNKENDIDKFHYHEVIDRVNIINLNMDEFVLNHPVIQNNNDLKQDVNEIIEKIGKLYQDLGYLSFKKN